MPRLKTYSRSEALDGATKIFWKKGYSDTSIEDLVQSTGVSRYGFYDEFGGKKQLFLDAVDYYFESYVKPFIKVLEQEDASLANLKQYFDEVQQYGLSEQGKNGCFICNIITQQIANDEQIAGKIDSHQDYMINLFANILERSKVNGEVRESINPQDVATQLYVILQGSMVMVKTKSGAKKFSRSIEATFAAMSG